MRVSEIFLGIQGEGATAGRVRLFIRTTGCTLKCSFCDTQYHKESRDLTKADKKLLKENKLWCITGGEPLIHQEQILELINEYKPSWVEIETNGTLELKSFLSDKVDQLNISPKEQRFQPKILTAKPNLLRSDYFNVNLGKYVKKIIKFVYSDKESEEFIRKTIEKYNLQKNEIWVMPEGKTKKELEKHTEKVWNFCLDNKFNFSPRLHVMNFGDKKGV